MPSYSIATLLQLSFQGSVCHGRRFPPRDGRRKPARDRVALVRGLEWRKVPDDLRRPLLTYSDARSSRPRHYGSAGRALRLSSTSTCCRDDLPLVMFALSATLLAALICSRSARVLFSTRRAQAVVHGSIVDHCATSIMGCVCQTALFLPHVPRIAC